MTRKKSGLLKASMNFRVQVANLVTEIEENRFVS